MTAVGARRDTRVRPRSSAVPPFAGKGHDNITSAWFCWPGEGRLVWLPS